MAILQKALLFCALFCSLLLPVHGQLVYNPQFHLVQSSLSNCATANVAIGTSPSGGNPIQNMCQNWYTPTQGSPDFFYGCDNTGPDFGVPTSARFGVSRVHEDPLYPSATYPPTARAYAGIDIIDGFSIHTREYITQTLPTPLLVGNRYEISFMVRAYGEQGHDYVERLGCLLSTATPSASGNGVISKTAGDFGDQLQSGGWHQYSWQTVRAQVLITGSNKQVLTIGNFEANNWTSGGHAYYLIDNVQICEPCAVDVSATRVPSADPEKCCYDIRFTYTSNNSCQAAGFRLRRTTGYPPASIMATHTGLITGEANEVFNVCVDRFTSGVVLVDILAADGSVLCTKPVELPCNCQCSNSNASNPAGFSVVLERTWDSPQCCWNIVVRNSGECDVLLRGVGVSVGAPGTLSLAGGYSMYPAPTVPPSNYISKNNTNGGDNYAAGTTTVIGKVCLPTGATNVPVYIQFLRSIANDGYIEYCGGTYNTTLSCNTGDCCSNIRNLSGVRMSSNPCCFHIEGTIESSPNCMFASYSIAEEQGGMWNIVATESFAPTPSYTFSQQVCLSSTSSPQSIRIDFRDANGAVLCTKYITVQCSGEGSGIIGVNKMGASDDEAVRALGVQAVPNPASNATTIHYTVREQADVRIQVYTPTGDLVAELQPGTMQAGEQHSALSTAELSAGVYYVRVQVGSATATIPVVVVK